MLACEMIARYVRDAGVTLQFGLLGEANIAVATALEQIGVPFASARREDGAVGMADGWARRSGGIGFVSVTYGPGFTNTVTALTEASRHRTPLVLLTGLTARGALHNSQRFPIEQLAELTGAGWRAVETVETVAAGVRAAFANAVAERRPYVLAVASEILYRVVDKQLLDGVLPESLDTAWRDRPAPSVVPDARGVRQAVDLLAQARRPVVVMGRGAVETASSLAVDRLAEHLGAPLATTLLGKGLGTHSPRHIGICGGFATASGADAIESADVIVAIGCSLNPWTATELLHGAKIIHVDIDPAAIGRWTPVECGVVGDACITADAITAGLRERCGSDPRPLDTSAVTFEASREVRLDDARPAGVSATAPFHVNEVALAMREVFPPDAVMSSDTGQATAEMVSYIQVNGARHFVYPIHAGSIGLGLGAAIGAAMASQGEWVVHFTGDGSLMMAMQELATVAQQSPRLAIVVLDDQGYGAEILYTKGRGLPSHLAALPHPDFGALANAFGLSYVEVESLEDLGAVRTLAQEGGRPTIFHVRLVPGSASRFFRDYSTVERVASWSGAEN